MDEKLNDDFLIVVCFAKALRDIHSEQINRCVNAEIDLDVAIGSLEDARESLLKMPANDPLTRLIKKVSKPTEAQEWLSSDHVKATLKRFKEEEENNG